jgi:F-type H+-transporting ATPase subunit epsilon
MAEASGTFRLEIVTPDEVVLDQEVRELVAPGTEGYFGVLPGHLPFVTTLDIGELTYRWDGEERHLVVSGGYAEVRRESVVILADRAERAEEIDITRAQRARERAEQRLEKWIAGTEDIDYIRARGALQRALARLQAATKGRQ